jgi:hypothetical protein
VFPWDARAVPGDPYTPQYTLPVGVQTGGRFDLPDVPTLYLALDEPAHALAEVLQPLRGKRQVRPGHLRRKAPSGVYHPQAIVETWLPDAVFSSLPDLGDPATLVRHAIRPDDLASHDRTVTQGISRRMHDAGFPGFRWWSAFRGEWHVAVLYMDRVDRFEIQYGPPSPLHIAHPLVAEAAAILHLGVVKP